MLMVRRKLALILLVLFTGIFFQSGKLAAQTENAVPSFAMTLSNGQYFKSADLSKGRPLVLIYFAPDCDHCHTLMNVFFQRADEFRDADVVMVTFKPVQEVASFEKAYQTYRYTNIKVGTEGTTYFLRLFYKLQNTPFTALYDRKGKLVSTYRKETPLNDLLRKLKQL